MSINKVFRVPVMAYDLSTGELVAADRYFSGQPMGTDTWTNHMLKAQGAGKRLAYSSEWSGAQRFYRKPNPAQACHLCAILIQQMMKIYWTYRWKD